MLVGVIVVAVGLQYPVPGTALRWVKSEWCLCCVSECIRWWFIGGTSGRGHSNWPCQSNVWCWSVDISRLFYIEHTHTQPFKGLWSGTTRVGWYQKKLSPTHARPDHRTSFIIFLYLQWSMASSLFILRAWRSSRTTSLQVLFGLPLGLGPSTSCSIHFFTQSSSSFRSTCPYLCSTLK